MRHRLLGRVTGTLLDTLDALMRERWRGKVSPVDLGRACGRNHYRVLHCLRALMEVGWVSGVQDDGEGTGLFVLTEQGAREGLLLLKDFHPAYTGGPPIPDD